MATKTVTKPLTLGDLRKLNLPDELPIFEETACGCCGYPLVELELRTGAWEAKGDGAYLLIKTGSEVPKKDFAVEKLNKPEPTPDKYAHLSRPELIKTACDYKLAYMKAGGCPASGIDYEAELEIMSHLSDAQLREFLPA